MSDVEQFSKWLIDYAVISERLAPLLARYATGGTNFDRKAILVAELQEEYRARLEKTGDTRPSMSKLDQLVHTDPRFLDCVEQTETSRHELFQLSSQRQVVLFKLRKAVRPHPDEPGESELSSG